MNKQHTLWIEKYRPTSLNDFIGNDSLKSKIQEYIDKNDLPNVIFSGRAGLGKSSLAKLIIKNISCDYIYINASDENGIDTIRDKIKGFVVSATFQPIKIVVLEEGEFITQPGQMALRNLMEEYSLNTRFILTCNYLDKLTEPIQSRCEIFEFSVPSKGEIAKHLCLNILDIENIKYDSQDIVKLVNEYYPDIRSIVKMAQSFSSTGELKYDEKQIGWQTQILNLLKKPTTKSWYEVRQIIANNKVDDFITLIEYLYDHLEDFSKGKEAEIIIELDNHQYFQKSVPDKEINIMSMFAKILKSLLNKQVL